MRDPRAKELAKVLVNYSTSVKEGDNVMISAVDSSAFSLVEEIIDVVAEKGAHPFVTLNTQAITRKLYKNATDSMVEAWKEKELKTVEMMDAYIGVRGLENKYELSDVKPENMMNVMNNFRRPLSEEILKKRWCGLAFPTPGYAQAAQMSMEAFEEFYYNVSTLDYAKMSEAMDPMVELMKNTDRVHIKGPGKTDLTFSIKGLNPIKCAGQYNIPDGEIFTAPVRDSVNGVIEYNTPTIYLGTKFENLTLTFKDGKIVEYVGSNMEKLDEIFNIDEGARYVGEFAIGVNPYITKPMVDILFDEKIAGSIHFTPGKAYGECNNGNESAIHWDLVLIQTPEFGGGEIFFDDKLIRKDGRFIIPELELLNPENLK